MRRGEDRAGWTGPELPSQWTWSAERPPWVGRRRELDQLERCWSAVEHGARQLVLVAAEPGAGKSRLVTEVSSALHARGVPVLVGQCNSDLGLPFDPLVTPIRALLTDLETGRLELADDLQGDAGDTRRLLRLLTSGESASTASQVNLEAPALGAVIAALAGACASGPVVMVLEDLHWAAESGLRALRHLVERSADLPLLILATHRDSPPDMTDVLSQLTTEMLRWSGTQVIQLQGLGEAEISSYLTAVGAGAADAVDPLASVLRERTDGNPYLLGEVWRDLRDHGGLGHLAKWQLTVPGSLQVLIRQRLGHLRPVDRRAVSLGAVIGESFDVPLIRAATSEPWSPEMVFQALSNAASEGLVQSDPDQLGHYRFAHALARQAVLLEMKPYDRACAHAAVAQALEVPSHLPDPTLLVQLAHHFSMAIGLGMECRAVAYLKQAAALAATRLAHSDAAALLERAAELAPDGGQRDELRLSAAASLVRAGHLERARSLNEAVATLGDPSLQLAAAVGHEAASWPTGVGAARSVELLAAALDDAALRDGVTEQIAAAAAYGRALIYAGRTAEGDDVLDDAVSRARRTGDASLLLTVLTAATTCVVNLRVEQGVERFRRHRDRAVEAASLAVAAGELRPVGSASQARIYASYILGDPVQLAQALADLHRVGRETQEPFFVWRADLLSVSPQLMRCEFAAAGESLRESSRMALSFGHAWGQVDGPLSLPTFILRRETGGLEFTRRLLESGQVPGHLWAPGLVALYWEVGMAEPARTVLRRTLDEDLPGLRTSVTWPSSLALLSEVAVGLRDSVASEILLAEAESFSGLNLMAAEFLAPFGSADRLRAGLLSVLGRPGVEDLYAAALAMDTLMGSPLHVATTRAEWARWLQRSHAPSQRVQEQTAPARELAHRHGLMRVHRVLGVETQARPRSRAGGLTARELEVIRLVGLGRSNREIARALFISEHTAANHVRSILTKTNSANRTAAAHYALRHGMLDDSDHGGE